MDLEERIARLIDPDAWWYADKIRDMLPGSAANMVSGSKTAARRVIDGLGLHAEPVYATTTASAEGPAVGERYVTAETRTEAHAPRVRQIYEEDM